MRIRHRFGFASGDRKVLRFLDTKERLYQQDSLVITVEVFEDDTDFAILRDFACKYDAVDVVDAIYEPAELESARWLAVRSEWWSQYPQPKDKMGYLYATYDTEKYCSGNGEYLCGKGLVQKNPFIIQKNPRWGPRNFMMLNWVPDELFVSIKATAILRDSELKGFSYWCVLDKEQRQLEKIKQIYVENVLPKSLNPGSVKKRLVCSKCGFEKIVPEVGPLRFQKSAFENINCDIIKTEDKFGEIGCDSLILVSHNFYDTVVKNKLEKGLVFEPIELV